MLSVAIPPRGEKNNFVQSLGGEKHLESAGVRAPQKGPENWKSVEKCRKYFWHFLTIFDVFLPCAKIVEKLFDDFWRFLTWPLSAGPLLQSADGEKFLSGVSDGFFGSSFVFFKSFWK